MINRFYLSLLGMLFGVTFMAGCGREKAADEFLIEGQLANYPSKLLLLDLMEGEVKSTIDSTQTDAEGNFKFYGKLPENSVVQVRTPDNKNVLMVPGTSHLIVKGDYRNMQISDITGDALNAQLAGYRQQQLSLYHTYLNLYKKMNSESRTRNLERWRRAEARTDSALLKYQDFLKAFTDTVQYPILRGIAAMSYEGKEDFYRLHKVTQVLQRQLPGHPITETLVGRVASHQKRWFAVHVPVFSGMTASGKEVDITETRGKVVLFYVWASYCEYSRRENERLSKFLRENPNPDLILVDYSIDEDLNAWRSALEKDSLPSAHHFISPDGWNCPPISEMGVRSIPFTYLVDHQGVIRSACLYEPDLKEDLDSLVQLYKAK